jgi:acyl-CoA thioesterase-1
MSMDHGMTLKFVLRLLILMVGLPTLAGCDSAPSETTSSAVTSPGIERRAIVCMGDSLTAGYGVEENQAYPALLGARLQADGHAYEVINAGVSGETSSGALARLDWMLTLDPDIVILETGANDGLRGVDPALTRKNIDAIVTRLKAEDIVVVLAGMQMVRNLGPAFTKSFAAIYPEVAAAHDLILIPFFLEGVAGRASLNQSDGIHPTAEGYRIITANLYPYALEAIQRRQAR